MRTTPRCSPGSPPRCPTIRCATCRTSAALPTPSSTSARDRAGCGCTPAWRTACAASTPWCSSLPAHTGSRISGPTGATMPSWATLGDLEDFLFATSRQSLQRMGEGLRRLNGERCFYCGLPLGASADVDHYVPFSLYPRDLAHRAAHRGHLRHLLAVPARPGAQFRAGAPRVQPSWTCSPGVRICIAGLSGW
jgi:hypothetical protein